MRRWGGAVVAGVALCSFAWAWGHEGHALVALLAMKRLGPAARQQVGLLIPNGGLSAVASWADDLRDLQRHAPNTPAAIRNDPDALAFLPHDPSIDRQLAVGGLRLAALLNAIWPSH